MRILIISPLPPPAGGIASWTRMYLDWTQKRSMNVNIVNTAVVGERVQFIHSKWGLYDEIRRTLEIFKGLIQKIAACQPEIVHLNSPCGKLGIIRDYLSALIVNCKGIPLVVHYRCNIGDQINSSKMGLFFFKRLTCLANLILVLNTGSQEFVKKMTSRGCKQIANFIDEDYIIKQPKHISDKIGRILFVGHVHAEKGSNEILEAAHYFPEIKFVLAGPVSAKISAIKIPTNIELLGDVNREEVKILLDEADIFLFPSYSEGFANALVEAMARGVPVITTPVGANADMVEQSGGIFVSVGSVADIVSAINIMSSSRVRRNMSLWNVRKVEKNYTIDIVMHSLLEAYKETLGNGIEYC